MSLFKVKLHNFSYIDSHSEEDATIDMEILSALRAFWMRYPLLILAYILAKHILTEHYFHLSNNI